MAQNAKTLRGSGEATAARTLESITGQIERHSIGMPAVVEFGANQTKSTRGFEEQQRKMLAQHARVSIPILEPAAKVAGNVRYAVASDEARQLVGVIGDVRAGGDTVVIDQLIAKDKARQMGGTISGHVALEFMKCAKVISNILSQPILQILLVQEGVDAVNPAYTTPFHALGPLSNSSESTPTSPSSSASGPPTACAKKPTPTTRASPSALSPTTPPPGSSPLISANSILSNLALSTSLVTFDDYPMDGVKAKAEHMPGDAALDEEVARLGNEFRQILHEGTGRDFVLVYLNYAFGNEGPEQWYEHEQRYGHEEWRMTRLQEVKVAYDSNDLFSFYGPVA
ncbi:FAD binding domain-containing protein [Colletotrichum karsti]|uniref:FAD binding domain-containing protein n=1 Tax=Colletotrichum karsti TaxID=1095194 RepID=A0A9P6ID65_9PEZI|nr:FAD binding domain-containing protein [Colletotrichum karsti]KAF9880639.1 FAD binding domain-containing protein [Colletotrichum karsti]